MSKKTYKLYALAFNDVNIEAVSSERFHRMTSKYILVYTNGRKPKHSVEITAKEAHRLTDYDKSWLRDCAELICTEALLREDNIEKTMNLLRNVEDSLEEQSKELQKEDR